MLRLPELRDEPLVAQRREAEADTQGLYLQACADAGFALTGTGTRLPTALAWDGPVSRRRRAAFAITRRPPPGRRGSG